MDLLTTFPTPNDTPIKLHILSADLGANATATSLMVTVSDPLPYIARARGMTMIVDYRAPGHIPLGPVRVATDLKGRPTDDALNALAATLAPVRPSIRTSKEGVVLLSVPVVAQHAAQLASVRRLLEGVGSELLSVRTASRAVAEATPAAVLGGVPPEAGDLLLEATGALRATRVGATKTWFLYGPLSAPVGDDVFVPTVGMRTLRPYTDRGPGRRKRVVEVPSRLAPRRPPPQASAPLPLRSYAQAVGAPPSSASRQDARCSPSAFPPLPAEARPCRLAVSRVIPLFPRNHHQGRPGRGGL